MTVLRRSHDKTIVGHPSWMQITPTVSVDMNFFDSGIVSFFNQFAQSSWVFDKTVDLVEKNGLLKGGAIMALFWYAWFRADDERDRRSIVATLLAALVAMASARLLATFLPHRARPVHEDALDFELPHGRLESTLEGWSSFPSDYAVLFFTLSVGLFFVSRPLGSLALLHTLVVISLPRIYLGLHYPTDILAGALLGGTLAVLANVFLIRSSFVSATVRMSRFRERADGQTQISLPGIFYPLFFLFSYQVADMFTATRAVLNAIGTLAEKIF